MAEGVGFEPTRGYSPLPVFKTGALNRSATLPTERGESFTPSFLEGEGGGEGVCAFRWPVGRGPWPEPDSLSRASAFRLDAYRRPP